MSEEDKHFIKRYEELLDKGYCDCNEMNCIDNNSPRRILKIVKEQDKEIEKLKQDNEYLNKVNIELSSRNSKAIEYIETHQLNFKKGTTTFGSERLSMEERKLLDILRGDNNGNNNI